MVTDVASFIQLWVENWVYWMPLPGGATTCDLARYVLAPLQVTWPGVYWHLRWDEWYTVWDRSVKVIRLVGRNTVEEMILRRAEHKLRLTHNVMSSATRTSDAADDAEDDDASDGDSSMKVTRAS